MKFTTLKNNMLCVIAVCGPMLPSAIYAALRRAEPLPELSATPFPEIACIEALRELRQLGLVAWEEEGWVVTEDACVHLIDLAGWSMLAAIGEDLGDCDDAANIDVALHRHKLRLMDAGLSSEEVRA